MPAAKPTTARRPPARAPTVTAPLDFDDEEVEEGALPVAVPVLEPEPEPEPEPVVVLDDEPVADDALAAAWNAANVLFAVGLIAKTMPDLQ
jgi:hypothetical protein